MIDITGLNKAEVLKTLYDHSHTQGMGFLQAVPHGSVTVEHCQMLLENTGYPYFDYLYGRVMKVDLSGDSFDERLYDRDNGNGTAMRAILKLRRKGSGRTYGELLVDCANNGLQVQLDAFSDKIKIRFNSVEAVDRLIFMCEEVKHKMMKEV